MKPKSVVFLSLSLLVFLFSIAPLTQALTLQEIIQGYDNSRGQVLGASTPALVAHAILGNPFGGSNSFSSSGLNTSGATLLVIIVGSYAHDPANNIISDSNGNTWHHLITQGNGFANQSTVIWYAYDHGGSPLVVGPGQTFSDSNGSYDVMAVSAYSGTQTSSDPFDQQNGQTSVGSGSFSTGSISPSTSGELLVAGFSTISTTMTNFSIDSGLSKLDFITGSNQNLNGADAYYVQPTTGAINPTFTSIGDSSPVAAVALASFKASGAASSPPPSPSPSPSPSPAPSPTPAPPDTTPPVISSISSSGIGSSSANLFWTTDENSDSQVDYGTTTGYGSSSALNSSLVTSHSVSVSSLSASTLYHYRVKSRDASGNLAVSADNVFTTSAVSGGGGPSVTWTQYNLAPNGSTVPYQTGWEKANYDPASDKIVMGGHTTGTTIYNDSLWTVDLSGANPVFNRTFYSGTQACNADTATVPKDRHYYSQGWMDTKRDILFQMGGACGSVFSDLYKIPGPNFTSPQQVNPTALPSSSAGEGAAIYDSNDDIAFLYLRTIGNYPKLYRYCSTIGNPGGTLTATQINAGCTANSTDSFEDITPASMPGASNAVASMGFVWDSVNHVGVMAFGYSSTGLGLNETWVYNPLNNSWSQKANSNCPVAYEPGMVFDPQSGLVLVHVGSNQDCGYNAATNTWSSITSNGGPVQSCSSCDGMALDTAAHKLFYLQGSGGSQGFWVGQLSYGSGSGTSGADTQAPSVPGSLSATAVSSSGINLSWSASSDNVGVSGYKIYRGGVQIAISATDFYSDSGLAASTLYTYTVSAYDAAGNNSSQSVSASATTSATAGPSSSQMRSGSGAPSGAVGNNGDLYHRTDTNAIYGPKANGSWPATFSYVLGIGCTTAYHIDKDCDGYGLGPTSETVDPNPLFGPDGDDNDAAVNTPASVTAKWGTMSAFLTHLGYPTNRIYYIDPVNGSDASGNGTVGNPYQHYDAIGATLHDGNGGTVIYRTSLTGGLGICGYGGPCYNPTATSPSSPLVIMAYPGESVVFYSTGPLGADSTYGFSNNVTYDGFILRSSNQGFGHALSGSDVINLALRNSEVSGFNIAWEIGGGAENPLIEGNLFHDIEEHAIYPTSAGLYTAGQFNCSSWTWNTAQYAYNPFSNMVVRNNLFYNSGIGGFEPIHLNAIICGATVSGNIVWNSGGTGLGLQTGVQNAVVENNLIFSNQSAAMTLSVYGCDNNGIPSTQAQIDSVCQSFSAGVTYYPGMLSNITIRDNTLWTGQVGPPGSGDCGGSSPCTLPSYGIDVIDYSAGTPGNRWIKNLTIQNNLILSYNDCSGGRDNFKFEQNSFPDGYTIKNNMLYNLYPGHSQCLVMNITPQAQSSFAGDYNFAQFQSYNTAKNGGNLFNDPLFQDVQLGYYTAPNLFNFHLQSTSPAIGAGISGGPSTDLAGLTRSNPPSIGAYEYSGSLVSPPSTPTISSFLASPSSITSGGSTSLSWSVANATSLSIDQSIGPVTGTSKSVSPTQTTTYTLTATNSSGSMTAQTTVTVNLNPDATPPTVSLTSPASNQTVTGSISLSATASDPNISGQVQSGLFQLSVLIDGSVYATSSTGTLSKPLDTTTLTNASHSLVAVARDNAGNQASSSPISITVNNTPAQKFPRTFTLTSLEGLVTIPANQSLTVTILSGNTVLETQTLTPTAGKYTVTFLSSDPQLVNLRIKANGYLSQLLSNVDTTVNSALALTVPQLPSGDVNNDNIVNSLDYSSLNSHWLQNFPAADLNLDGLVNSLDFGILKNEFGRGGG